MGIAPGLNTHQKKEQSGAPFAAGAANNGVSVDPVSGKIVLGDSKNGLATLLGNRYIDVSAFASLVLYIPGAPDQSIIIGNNGSNVGLSIQINDALGNTSWQARANSTGNSAMSSSGTAGMLTYQSPTIGGPDGQDFNVQGAFDPDGVNNNFFVFNCRKSCSPNAWNGIFVHYNSDMPGSNALIDTNQLIAYRSTRGNNLFSTLRGKTGIRGISAPTAGLHVGNYNTGAAGFGLAKFQSGVLLTIPEAHSFENDGSNLYYTDQSAVRYTLAKVLTASAVLNFPNTGANGQSDLTVNVPGAALSDVVAIGVDAASATVGTFWGFVSAANTVIVRFHNTSGGAVDPASGTFKISVTKF